VVNYFSLIAEELPALSVFNNVNTEEVLTFDAAEEWHLLPHAIHE